MSQSSESDLHWISILEDAAEQVDGGCQVAHPSVTDYPYAPPNQAYQRLFRQATIPQRNNVSSSPYCAGWLSHDGSSVFVAHSVPAAIWLLREILGSDTLPDEGWEALVHKAYARNVYESSQEAPPSAQQPRVVHSLPTKRAAASPLASPSKQVRLTVTPPTSHTPETEVQEVPVLVTKVSNHNRHAEKARTKKLEAIWLQKRHEAGLVKPSSAASSKEHAAYASIKPKDEPTLSWLLKQPIKNDLDFYCYTTTPYATALGMLERANAVGDSTSQISAAAFLRSWRTYGTPFQTQEIEAVRCDRSVAPVAHQSALASAWALCDRYEKELDVIHIKYRWAMAFLGQAYTEKVNAIEQQEMAANNDTTRN